MRQKKLGIILILISILFLSNISYAAIDKNGNLQIKNNYISIIVNQDKENNGRFAVDVTGGNPVRNSDNGKPLIYGRPKPWTSYTTIKIDGENYIFGGKTEKRAGQFGKYGTQVKAPYITDQGGIETVYKYGDITVIQSLSFVKSNTTGLPDTAQIKYKIKNNGKQRHKVGLRVMLDTMLGTNDGAPFRIGANSVISDKVYTKNELPVFWQAFDQLTNPHVTAQGTVRGNQVTAPDKLYFADWGSLADGVWNFDYNPGEKFMRKGEFQLDSALALFWEPNSIPPGQSRTYITNYGLGGITIVPGILSLGVSSPAEVVLDKQTKSFPVVAYIQNTAEIKAKEVVAKIELPPELTLAEGENRDKKLGNLKPSSTGQVVWEVVPKEGTGEGLKYTVKVIADNTDDNSVDRSVKVVGPPKLELSVLGPKELKVKDKILNPNPFKVVANIKNSGASMAYDPTVSIILPPGLKLVNGEKKVKYLGYLEAKEELEIPWQVEATGINGELPYAIKLNSINTTSKSKLNFLTVPKLEPVIYLEAQNRDVEVGNYLKVIFRAANIKDFYRFHSKLKYDTDNLEAVYVSRGTLFVEGNRLLNWQQPSIDNQKGLITLAGNLDKERNTSDTIAVMYFKVKKAGAANFKLNELSVKNEAGNEVDYNSQGLDLVIKGGEEYD
ncbi:MULTISPECIES: cohesin domain-containing protein [unclassified Candidatus Frackibacter]|uniref:cohesin domain-containing protein n=1 Tax=unclassified Candidatus Frackibacter TaxID=2648818 RepID=UPI000883F70C|nr:MULTISPECIES: cohesin domain-containing protein [unclassified Candidatus Frackibacter]SDC51182.1 Cohesin domain-containing protein [Candidatus Frackibacter sp. WG11]SEM40744.1 Cohesin domain-containing protein [Candidatus Frackibacter sp. WG12]SFL75236.1 Cohesin domain-containing protein [Candidatus Frackibacter sp. WG13]